MAPSARAQCSLDFEISNRLIYSNIQILWSASEAGNCSFSCSNLTNFPPVLQHTRSAAIVRRWDRQGSFCVKLRHRGSSDLTRCPSARKSPYSANFIEVYKSHKLLSKLQECFWVRRLARKPPTFSQIVCSHFAWLPQTISSVTLADGSVLNVHVSCKSGKVSNGSSYSSFAQLCALNVIV